MFAGKVLDVIVAPERGGLCVIAKLTLVMVEAAKARFTSTSR